LISGVMRALLFGVLHVPLAAAQGTASEAQMQRARARGRDAIALMERADYAAAEHALTDALTLHQAPTLQYMRGQAREHLGRLLGAMTDYQAAANFPVVEGEHPKYAQARADAHERLTKLPSSIPRLTLSARGALVRLTVNGAAWPVQSLPTSRSLDPGSYTIETLDGEGQRRSYRVELPPREHESLTLEGSSVSIATNAELDSAPEDALRPQVDRSTKSSSTVRYTLGAATLALTAGAIVTGIVALQKRSDYHEQNRNEAVGTQEKLRMRSVASTWGWVSTTLGGAAVAGAAAFVYLTFVPPDEHGSATVQLTATGTF
jgi:hypothetical protein